MTFKASIHITERRCSMVGSCGLNDVIRMTSSAVVVSGPLNCCFQLNIMLLAGTQIKMIIKPISQSLLDVKLMSSSKTLLYFTRKETAEKGALAKLKSGQSQESNGDEKRNMLRTFLLALRLLKKRFRNTLELLVRLNLP